MALVVSGISLPFEEPQSAALELAEQTLQGVSPTRAYVVKRSLDARKHSDIRFVYSVALELPADMDEGEVARRLAKPGVTAKADPALEIIRGKDKLSTRPVVVGFGPAGIFAGLLLARQGLRPLILERGSAVEDRVAQVEAFWSTGALHTQSNVQFGEGGAGTFSDGKLVTRIGDPRCGFVLEQLAAHGAPEEIRWQARPHVGTDLLRDVVRSIRREIIDLGGEVRFQTALTGIAVRGGKVAAVATTSGTIPAEVVVLAPGHSARDLFETLHAMEVPMSPKPFSVGARIEHLQADIDQALYGDKAGHPLLPKGEYQLSHREGDRGVYTFCMCPGGVVVPAASEQGMVVTNGMSLHARDGAIANAALVVSVGPEDYGDGPLDGVELQRRLETAAYLAGGGGYVAPAQTVDAFLAGGPGLHIDRVRPSYARGVTAADLTNLLPDLVVDMMRTGLRRFDRKLKGFASGGAVLTGVETRTSSPLRILRGENMQSTAMAGLYPCGEGAGYAGGIISAAVDGVRAAQAVLEKYAE